MESAELLKRAVGIAYEAAIKAMHSSNGLAKTGALLDVVVGILCPFSQVSDSRSSVGAEAPVCIAYGHTTADLWLSGQLYCGTQACRTKLLAIPCYLRRESLCMVMMRMMTNVVSWARESF